MLTSHIPICARAMVGLWLRWPVLVMLRWKHLCNWERWYYCSHWCLVSLFTPSSPVGTPKPTSRGVVSASNIKSLLRLPGFNLTVTFLERLELHAFRDKKSAYYARYCIMVVRNMCRIDFIWFYHRLSIDITSGGSSIWWSVKDRLRERLSMVRGGQFSLERFDWNCIRR